MASNLIKVLLGVGMGLEIGTNQVAALSLNVLYVGFWLY